LKGVTRYGLIATVGHRLLRRSATVRHQMERRSMELGVTGRGPVCYLGHSSADSGVPLMPRILISPVVQLFDCRCYFGSHRLQRPQGGFTSSWRSGGFRGTRGHTDL